MAPPAKNLTSARDGAPDVAQRSGTPSPWVVDPHSLVPPSQQLVAAVLDAMGRGELGPEDRLPSVRGMATMALVNPNTVTKAYRDLERMGATEGRNGSGVFVTPGGPALAAGARLAETSSALLAAARAALRAGHTLDSLHALLDEAGDDTPAASAPGAIDGTAGNGSHNTRDANTSQPREDNS